MEFLVCLLWVCVAQLCWGKRYHCYEWEEHVHQRDVGNQLQLPMRLRIEHTDDESRAQSGELRLLRLPRCCKALWELNTKYRPGSKAVHARD